MNAFYHVQNKKTNMNRKMMKRLPFSLKKEGVMAIIRIRETMGNEKGRQQEWLREFFITGRIGGLQR
jgi:hypothetical protein